MIMALGNQVYSMLRLPTTIDTTTTTDNIKCSNIWYVGSIGQSLPNSDIPYLLYLLAACRTTSHRKANA